MREAAQGLANGRADLARRMAARRSTVIELTVLRLTPSLIVDLTFKMFEQPSASHCRASFSQVIARARLVGRAGKQYSSHHEYQGRPRNEPPSFKHM